MLKRHDLVTRASVPELGKVETSYPTPNKADLVVIERVPIKPGKYVPLPYHSPHPDYDNNGLFLVWQGKVKSENNQTVVVRVYANDNAVNEDWYNASIKYSGDIITVPVYVRSYIELRRDYAPAAQASKLTRVIRLKVVSGGTYTSVPTVTITPVGAGTAPTANAIMNPAKTQVIALELLTPGDGLVANPTIAFSGGGQTVAAVATAEIQLTNTYLVKEETTKLDSEDSHMASLFIKVHRVYETLPGPWLPDTRYDNDLGPIQMYRRAVLNTGQIGGTITATAKTNYASREGSALVLWEIIEAWSNGTGTPGTFPYPVPPGVPPGANPNPLYPILVLDDYERNGEGRGAYQRTSQIVVATGSEVATETRNTGVLTKISYEPYSDNPFLLKKIIETWVEVIIRDFRVTSENGGGILAHNEDTGANGDFAIESGFLVTDSKLTRINPNETRRTTEKLDPSSATPVLELLYGGLGYGPTVPTIGFVGGTGAGGAVAVAVLGFGIDTITPVLPGGDFTHPPIVGIVGGGGGGGFALATLCFGIASAPVTARGGNYTSPPGVTATGDGSGASFTAVLGFGIYFATITDPGGRAKGTLTSNNTNVSNNDTVTIGSKVYTFKTTLTPTEGQVLRGASADASLLNLIRAINHTGMPGTDYSVAVANTQVTADAAVVAHAFSVTAINPGTAANSIATTDTATTLSWGAVTLTGGFSYTQVPRAIFEGDGGGALGNIMMGHPVGSITVFTRGSSYETPPTITDIGSGSGLIATAVLAFGILSIDVDTAGSNFTNATVTIGPPETGGTQATADPIIAGDAVSSATVTLGGTGYTTGSPPTVGFGSGTGTGAAGTAVIGFAVTSVTLDTAGTAFTSFPLTVNISGGGGTGAAINIRMGLQSATAIVSAGTGYSVDEILTIVGGTSTTAAQLRVTSVGGGGDITGVSVETVGVYSGLTASPHSVTSSGAGVTLDDTLTYASDGDTNGAFYFIGTNFTLAGWVDPTTNGLVVTSNTSPQFGTALVNVVNRTYGAVAVTDGLILNTPSASITFDLGANRTLELTDWSYQSRGDDVTALPTEMTLEGSNNGSTWFAVDLQTGLTPAGAGDWLLFTLGAPSTAYRYFRVTQSALNSDGNNFFTANEFEFYGEFHRTTLTFGTGATFTLNWLVAQLNLSAGGTLYTSAPTIVISGGGGSGATGHATLASTGSVKSVTITMGGTGYTTDFSLSLTGGAGSGAAGTAHVAGVIVGFNVTLVGSGYITAPPITVTGDGTGATAHANLQTSGEVWRVDIIAGGSYEDPAPILTFSGGGGAGATGFAVLDPTLNFVHRLHVTLSGHGYTVPATVRFEYEDGSVPTDLAATTTLNTTDGEVVSVTVVSGGTTGYTAATLVFDNVGHGGTGAAADAVLATTGKVKSITVLQPGLYRTTPTIVLEGGGGTGATATATLLTTGPIVALNLTTPGNYDTPPTVTVTGANTALATALYHTGKSEWPPTHGFNTDAVNGIVIEHIKQVVPDGTPYPGRRPFPDYTGPFIDITPGDKWRSIQFTSKVDLTTLPPSQTFPVWHGLHLPPRLLSIKALWSDRIHKNVSALSSSAHGDVGTGLTGDIVVKSSSGFHGQILATGNRTWFVGPPPLTAIPPRVDIIGSSGSVILTETSSATHYTAQDDGGVIFGDSFNHIVRATDIRDHLIIPGRFSIIDADATSLPQNAAAVSGGGSFVGVFAAGTQSFLTVDLQTSQPAYDIRGHTFLMDIQPEQWRFNLWQLTLVYVTIPLNI